ncbi:MAG: hypothetical protein JXR76_05640 [Deltaproteobacteria bacterium]|nr:hypothetical protein [Deltaproteobacteria bacterium]
MCIGDTRAKDIASLTVASLEGEGDVCFGGEGQVGVQSEIHVADGLRDGIKIDTRDAGSAPAITDSKSTMAYPPDESTPGPPVWMAW